MTAPFSSQHGRQTLRQPQRNSNTPSAVLQQRSCPLRQQLSHQQQQRRRQKQHRGVQQCTLASAASATPAFEGDPGSRPSTGEKAGFFAAFWKFLRPHTIRGTILGASAVTARAVLENQYLIDWALLPRAALGVLALLAGNGYIVGINQVYDVSIDAVNKPFLPIAAGEISPRLAWFLVLGLAAAGLTITSLNFGPLITGLYTFGLFLGTIYSVPPFRLKRFAIPAALIIATVRGFLLNFGVYYAARAALGVTEFSWSPPVAFITVFVTVFAIVIAITKDLTDIEGDRQFKIETFATRLGTKRITLLAASVLMANYVGAVVLALRMPQAFNQRVMIAGNSVLAAMLARFTLIARRQEFSKAAVAQFYRSVWTLFYSTYFLWIFT